MPLLSWLIYRGAEQGYKHNIYMTSALIAGTVIGCTDWIDGLLARKYGPTVLDGLPPLVPWWMVALLFQREFFVTALRSAYEQRDLTLKTSYLAKAKTWTQMQGIGVMLLLLVEDRQFLTWVLVAGVVGPLIAMAGLYLVRRKLWRGALVMSASFLPILGLHLHGDLDLAIIAIMIYVLAITWISGLDYLVVGWKQLRGRGDFSR